MTVQQPPPGSPVLFLIFVMLAAYAIAESDKKWRTFGFILLSASIGIGIGAVVGFIKGSAAVGGSLGGLLFMVAGVATSIRQIIDNRRKRKTF